MGAEKKGVGSFLQLFDWNAKSRKKLFSSKSDLPEHFKQKKRCHGNLPVTRISLMDEDEIVGGSSIKGSSDYSCGSSVTDEDYCGTKAPGVVARLMGLDSLPTPTTSEPYSTPSSDSQSLQEFRYHPGNPECHNNFMFSGNLHDKLEAPVRSIIEPKDQRPFSRPLEKFQKDFLPPKSAKSIPITHHKLLSPIKRSNFIPSKDAAQIMEAAARIIEPGPQVTAKAKISLIGSSSVPLKLRDLKEKVEAAQKPAKLAEACRRPGESNAAKNLKGQSMNKSWNGSVDTPLIRNSSESEECSSGLIKKGKSISLALQAKENVQKRGGLNSTGRKNMVSQKEHGGFMSSQLFKSQPSTSKIVQRKTSAHGSSSVLRQNNQKQNCLADIGNSSLKPFVPNAQGRRGSGDSTLLRQRSSNKNAGNCRVGSRRLGSDVSNDRQEGSYSSTKDVSRKKRCINGNFQFEKSPTANKMSVDKSGNLIQSGSLIHRQINEPEECKGNATDIVSFTFTAPMTRPKPAPESSRELGGAQCNRVLLSSDAFSSSKVSPRSRTVNGGDDLSTLLEQKLRELTRAVEDSQQISGTSSTSASVFPHLTDGVSSLDASTTLPSQRMQDMIPEENLVKKWGTGISSTDFLEIGKNVKCHAMDGEIHSYHGSSSAAKRFLECQLPSPLSVLGPSCYSESCNFTDNADSNSTVSKLLSSVQAQEVRGMTSLKRLHLVEDDAELSDCASSTSTRTVFRKHVTTSSMVRLGLSTNWELEYVKAILCDIELIFKDYSMTRVQDIINPHLFDQLEVRMGMSNSRGCEPKLKRRVLFDCVSEYLDLRCRRHTGGGYRAWAKGLSMVRRRERLAEEVCNEISSWSGLGHCMVDELVDKDMSNQFGRWVDFECEAIEVGLQIENRLLNSLIDEVVSDMLVL